MQIVVRTLSVAALAAVLAACGGAVTASVTPGPSLPVDFPLGSWVTTISVDDLVAGGITGDGLVDENTGTFTKTYAADGTWTVAQESTAPVRWPVFSGTFLPIGPSGIQETTNFPADYAGEVVVFTWARAGSAIRFTVVNAPDPILPIITEAHVWQPK